MKQLISLPMTVALAALISLFPAPSQAAPNSGHRFKCLSALTPDSWEKREEMMSNLISTGVILGPFQLESMIRVAREDGLIPSGGRFDSLDSGARGASSPVDSKAPFKLLSLTLGSQNPAEAELRQKFAEAQVEFLEKKIFEGEIPKGLKTRKVAVKNTLNKFYFQGFTKPSIGKTAEAHAYFREVLKTPGGRQVLIAAFVNSNGTLAKFAYKNQAGPASIWALMGTLFGTGPALSIATGLGTGSFEAGAFLWVLSGGLNTAAVTILQSTKPLGAIQLPLLRAFQKSRLKKLVKKAYEDGQAAPPSSPSSEITMAVIEELTEKDLNLAFDHELLKTQSDDLEKVKPVLKNINFDTVSAFGRNVISRVDQAADLISLISKRMDILETNIHKLNNAIVEGRLKISSEEAVLLADLSIKSSGEIIQDAEPLLRYLTLLKNKLADHIAQARVEIESGRLDNLNTVEMQDVLQELTAAQSVLEPSIEVLPMTIQMAQGQRSILKNLRANLRGSRMSQSAQIAKLTDAITKLKELRISDQAKKESSK